VNAVEIAHEGVPLIVIRRQLGHRNLGITSIYLQGIDKAEIDSIHARRAPIARSAHRSGPDDHRLRRRRAHVKRRSSGSSLHVMPEARHGRGDPCVGVRRPIPAPRSMPMLPSATDLASRAPSTRAPRRSGR
jgi:hypothetical protein